MEQNAIFETYCNQTTSKIYTSQNYYNLSDSICSPPVATLAYNMFHILYIIWI
jgi:hypothetical protein